MIWPGPHASTFSTAPALKQQPITEPTVAQKPGTRLSPEHHLKLALVRVAMVLATLFMLRYLYWRAFNTLNPAARIFFYAFLGAEILSSLESFFFYFIAWNPTRYARPEAIPGKSVDVFIPTYNESVALLRDTVLCAVNMNYPHSTYILDDGNREEVRQLAEEFNCGYLPRSEREHAKAGNLNNSLRQTSGEFIVTLDADHVATPELIGDVIGFFADPKVAIVQGTQDFYNLDSFQHLINWKSRAGWQQQELFFSVIQPGKDRHNAAFYCGSPGMIRRSALEEIGGFPTGTVTEDMHTSLRLQKRGWRVIYYNRTLARGLAPQTYTGFATQWQRWGQGAMQVLRAERPFRGKELTVRQKICYFSSFYFYWMSYVKLFFVLTPVFSLLFGAFALVADPKPYAGYFLPYFCLSLACSIFLQGGLANFMKSEIFNLIKMHVLMKSVGGLFRRKADFKVTPKSRAAAAQLSEVTLPIVLILGLVIAMGFGFWRLRNAPGWGYTFWALAVNLFWAVVFLIMIARMAWRSLLRKEDRAAYRFRTHLNIPIRITYNGANGHAINADRSARNLNRTGVAINLDQPIRIGSEAVLELSLPGRSIKAQAKVMRNHVYRVKGRTQVSVGLRFTTISAVDQDEISKYLFQEIAPKESAMLRLTRDTQAEVMA